MGDQFRGRRVRPPLALAVRLPSVAGPSGESSPDAASAPSSRPPRRLRLAGYAAAAIMAERQGWRRTDRTASGVKGRSGPPGAVGAGVVLAASHQRVVGRAVPVPKS
ncbi:hypothetical protein GCM10029963_48170 [Micromonospora andamanensis]